MKEQFLRIFGGWMNQAKQDMEKKVKNFLEENDATPEELAELLDVSEDEIYMILEGDADQIELATFGKMLIATGHAIAIEKIENTPLGNYENVNPEVMREREPMREARPNPFMRQREQEAPSFPPFDPNRIPPRIREQMERNFGRPMHEPRPNPFMRQREERQETRSPFARMTRDELVKIINDKLWESEIDVEAESKEALVRFLEEKDRKIKMMRRRANPNIDQEYEKDPKVSEFLAKMKRNIKENPQFKNYMKQFIGDLDD